MLLLIFIQHKTVMLALIYPNTQNLYTQVFEFATTHLRREIMQLKCLKFWIQ